MPLLKSLRGYRKLGKEKKPDKRYREQFKFWLDTKKTSDFELADYITVLKDNHQFAKTIRNALLLVKSLQEGDLSELFRQFPELRKSFIDMG